MNANLNRFSLSLAVVCATGALVMASGCGASSSTNSNDSVSDSKSEAIVAAASQVGSDAGATEGGNVGLLADGIMDAVDASLERYKAELLSACSFSGNRTCSGSTGTIAWNSCTTGKATMTGGWSEAFSSNACCTTFGNSCSVKRTSTGSIATTSTGVNLTTSTTAHTTYDGTSLPGTGTTISMAGGTRTITMNGLHRVLKGPLGTTWSDHSIVTTTDITITGDRLTHQNRAITGGVVKLYHNRAKYTATSSFDTTNKVTWGSSTCCFPTSGLITTTLTGTFNGTASLQFTSTCGQATFTDTSGSTSTITLGGYHCQ